MIQAQPLRPESLSQRLDLTKAALFALGKIKALRCAGLSLLHCARAQESCGGSQQVNKPRSLKLHSDRRRLCHQAAAQIKEDEMEQTACAAPTLAIVACAAVPLPAYSQCAISSNRYSAARSPAAHDVPLHAYLRHVMIFRRLLLQACNVPLHAHSQRAMFPGTNVQAPRT